MYATDSVLFIDDDVMIISGAEPKMTFRPYGRRQLLSLCCKTYLGYSQLPYNQQNVAAQEHIFACWQYLKNGHWYAILTEDPCTGSSLNDDDHHWIKIMTSRAKEMQRGQMMHYELFFIPTEKTLARLKRGRQ